MKYCSKCGKELKNNKCPNCDKKSNGISSNPEVVKVLLWIFFLPIMLCIFIWKNDKIKQSYKIPIIVGIIVFCILIGIGSTLNENKLKGDLIKKCYSDEAYNKIEELYGISTLKGNYSEDRKCESLVIEDSNYNKITIEQKDGKLIGIKAKDKYVYAIDKSYDIYDSNTLELKEKADEKLKQEREEREKQEQKEKEELEKKQKEEAEKAKKLKIFTDIGLSTENSDEAYNILQQCGMTNVSSLKKSTETDNVKTYTTTYTDSEYKSYEITIFIAEQKLYSITSGSLIVYNRDQNITKNINDYILSDTEKTNLKTIAESYVKSQLKSPSTAKFPGVFLSPFENWQMEQSGTIYKVKSYVDAQNSFGATIRNEFYIELQLDSSGKLNVTKFQMQ